MRMRMRFVTVWFVYFFGLRGSSGTSQILFFSRWVMMMVIVDCNSLRMSLTFRAICKCFS